MPSFSQRAEYRAPIRGVSQLVNRCGTEGCRAPGNIPRAFGMLNAERGAFGENIPTPTGSELKSPYGFDSPEKQTALMESTPTAEYFTQVMSWTRWPAPPTETQPNYRQASHSHALSPLRGDHYSNNVNLDRGYELAA